jgi:endothelin-converting enzyme
MLSTSSQIGRIYHGTATVIGSATPAMASVTSITTVHSPIATQVCLFSRLRTAHMLTTMFDAQEPCLTPACIRLATDVLDSLDTVYDPCESFYDFTCAQIFLPLGISRLIISPLLGNGWVQKHPIPAGKNSFSVMSELVKKNQYLIRTLLESETVPESSADAQLLRKMRGLHRSCLDYDRLDELGSEPLVKVAKQV